MSDTEDLKLEFNGYDGFVLTVKTRSGETSVNLSKVVAVGVETIGPVHAPDGYEITLVVTTDVNVTVRTLNWADYENIREQWIDSQ